MIKKVMIITGASRGIGAATAVAVAARGYSVCVNYRSDQHAANEVVGRITDAGGSAGSDQTSGDSQFKCIYRTG